MKKALLILATLIATNSYAFNAIEVLGTYIAPGTYEGTYSNEKCVVEVQEVNYPKIAQYITISNSKYKVSKLVNNDAEFYYDEDARSFITKEKAEIPGEGYVIKSINIREELNNVFSFEVKDMYLDRKSVV